MAAVPGCDIQGSRKDPNLVGLSVGEVGSGGMFSLSDIIAPLRVLINLHAFHIGRHGQGHHRHCPSPPCHST